MKLYRAACSRVGWKMKNEASSCPRAKRLSIDRAELVSPVDSSFYNPAEAAVNTGNSPLLLISRSYRCLLISVQRVVRVLLASREISDPETGRRAYFRVHVAAILSPDFIL